MTGLRKLGLSLAALTLVLAQSGAAKPLAARVKQTSKPVAALAMDGPRVAYASGGKISVWNVDNGATSVVKGAYSKYGAEVAIAGKRVSWVTRYVVGNTYQTSELLYTAPVGGKAKLLRAARRYASGTDIGDEEWHGGWIAGAVGSGNTLAVSTWWSHGLVCTAQRLSLVTPTGLQQIVTGPGAIRSASTSGGRIAVLRNPEVWPYSAGPPTPAVTVGIYSSSGALLREIAPSSAREVALTGDRLVVLTEQETLEVYDWRSGTLLHTWRVLKETPRVVTGQLAAYGSLATYAISVRGSVRSVQVISLETGKHALVATASGGSLGYYGRDAAMSERGLVYAVTYREHGRFGAPLHGRLVFVPTAKLLAAVAPPRPHTLLATGPIHAFAQDSNAIAWVDATDAVHVKQLSTGRAGVVGWVSSGVIGGGPVAPPALALAGVRALWPTYAGGASRETAMKTGALGEKVPPGQTRASFVGIFSYSNDSGNGTYLAGLAGDGTTLAYGHTDELCSDENCGIVEVGAGGATLVTGRATAAELAVPAPAHLAVSSGRIAVVPAADHAVPIPTSDHPPQPAENGPVQVYDTHGHLLSRVQPQGAVTAVALTWPDLAVLVRRADGSNAIERYDARTGAVLTVATVSPKVTSISIGTRGVVYADGNAISLLDTSGTPKVLWRSTGRPFGVSIEGNRIAWAVSGGGHAYVQALTLGLER